MKKFIIWTMALVFSFCVSLAFAAEEKKAAPPEQKMEEKAEKPEKKEVKMVKKVKKAKKKKVKKEKEAKPEEMK
jgi:outer membrane lipoprotein-sorting protein